MKLNFTEEMHMALAHLQLITNGREIEEQDQIKTKDSQKIEEAEGNNNTPIGTRFIYVKRMTRKMKEAT